MPLLCSGGEAGSSVMELWLYGELVTLLLLIDPLKPSDQRVNALLAPLRRSVIYILCSTAALGSLGLMGNGHSLSEFVWLVKASPCHLPSLAGFL